MTTNGYEEQPADTRRRRIRLQVIFAGAAAVATLALFGVTQPGTTGVATGSTPPPGLTASVTSGTIVAVDDDDTNPSSGDIFTQNAQDQSTA
jgi:hypothetical protein